MKTKDKFTDYNEYQVKLIGITITYFQRLEYVISSLCCNLINEDENIGKRITTALSFRRLTDVLFNLYSYKFKQHSVKIEHLKKLIQTAISLEDQRNLIVHSQFVLTSLNREYTVRLKKSITFKKGYKENFERYPNEKIEEINKNLKKLYKDLSAFLPFTSEGIMNKISTI